MDCGVEVPGGDNCCAACFAKPTAMLASRVVGACRECGVRLTEAMRDESRLWTFCSRSCSAAYFSKHFHKERHCYWCGVAFQGHHAAAYCSTNCRVAAHRAGKVLSPKGSHLEPLPAGKRRKDAGPPVLKLRFQTLARDHFACTYCGRSAGDGVVLQVDHVNPRANGGTWDLVNLTTACWECNIGKGDAILTYKRVLQPVTPQP